MRTKDLVNSKLYNQDTFYEAFEKDLRRCQQELVIESPFITHRRLVKVIPTLKKLTKSRVKIIVNTRDPLAYDQSFKPAEALRAIALLQELGVMVLYTVGHHRKLAIIDQEILWEGSLNILSQNDSCEIMRRIASKQLANQMLAFLLLGKFMN